ncbi:hypothetical protein MTR_0782s0010 [Medicago truncatula]|uniref:DUF7745 domain-containing protein n=1 Tax=Medicago truncatula TaxID=3880 RepID=A0A072TDU8_MEDTR|nr:hypothetical protein MTR_0782s0010 [Medicago truncatula]
MNAIQIFLTQNPIPTLLADTYVSIHERTDKERGTIICCAPLLHIWITSHLPRPKVRPEYLPWSKKLMTLTPNDIVWFNPTCNPDFVIDNRDFFLYKEDDANQKAQFEKAWCSIVRKDRNLLGKRSVIAHEVYVQWVIDRANKWKMPYPRQRLVTSTISDIPLPLPPESLEGYQKQLDIERRERSMWEVKYRKKKQEYDTVKNLLDQQIQANRREKNENSRLKASIQKKEDFLDKICPGRKKRRMDLFNGPHLDSEE